MANRVWIALLMGVLVMPVSASEVSIFRHDERAEFLSGEWEGVSIEELGGLRLATAIDELATLEEPFVFSAASHPDGWVVGTGNSGKVLLVGRDGAVEELFSAPEREVFAVWADPDGTVYAGTSPHGLVYRIEGGVAEPFFNPEQAYIWGISRAANGDLLVATGLSAKLFGVNEKGKGRELASLSDSHLRSFSVQADGRVLLGSAGQGLILALGEKGKLRTLYDAAQPEVVAFAALPDGSVYAAALASEASLVELNKSKNPSSEDEDDEGDEDEEDAESLDEELGAGSRSASFDGARSILVHISKAGEAREVLSFDNETIYSLLWHDGALWIGTGLEGKLYRYHEDRLVLERDFEAKQIAALVAGPAGAAVVTTNIGSIHRLREGLERQGRFTSAPLDAETVARFGSFYWRGQAPEPAALAFRFRSGISAQPDQTWTPWSEPAAGDEISLSALPKGRHVQWQAILEGDGQVTPRLLATELSYQQENQKPRIRSLEVLAAGKILVPNSFNMQNQAYEPWSPRKDGIFNRLRPAETEKEGRLKGLWKVGYRTIRWKAQDANKDRLHYRLSFRPEGAGAVDGQAEWLPMVEDLEDPYYSFDSTVLPDGLYRFRLQASDRPASEAETALTAERISEAVVIDHTPPQVIAVEKTAEGFEIRVRDLLSPLRRAEYSIDAGPWIPAAAADGLVDGRREALRVSGSAEARLVLLRVMDAALNSTTHDLRSELP